MLRFCAIADSFGSGFEYRSQEFIIENNDFEYYRQHQLGELIAGQYTDDTQMSIAIALYLLDIDLDDLSYDFNAQEIAKYFVDCFHRDPRKGYSKGFQKVLEETENPRIFLEKINNHGKTTSNGGAMRAMPIGLHHDKEFVKRFSKFQAKLTHKGTGVLAAQAVALSVYYFKSLLGFPSGLPAFLNRELGANVDWHWNGARVAGTTDLGLKTARAAIHAVLNTRSFTECIKLIVGWGGDVDSVAAIAAGIISVSQFHDKDIPENLIRDLEPNGKYGWNYLVDLDKQLKEKFRFFE